ncbi:hypothetical protein F7725_009739 [Dissostichus mawsoni]|uniref:LON peptidase N-terminal domain and ring finger 3 n=1 Tax=Dissostichus mawsoni TaxID=36200 RepID=A0A7J5XLX9_DISMA|nr:hypothetical protein F7725_009739 [Dissostichus mawsoni]
MRTDSESMLQLAAEAFQSKNFDLAADIYECQLAGLRDSGSRRQELMVKRADALAFGGKFSEALDMYRQASETDRLGPVHLSNLIDYLASSIRRQAGGHRTPSRAGEAGAEAGCPGVSATVLLPDMSELSVRTGDSAVRTLLLQEVSGRERKEKERPGVCRECRASTGEEEVQSYRVNVVLSNLLAKWFPTPHQAGRLRREGNALYAERRLEPALEKYNQAIMIAPMDHILFSNRSQIHSSLRHHEKALRDAEMTCRLRPHWSKGHIRKAQALVSLGRTEEALRENLLCLSIEPDCRLAKTEAHKLLSDLLAPVTDQVPEHISDYTNILSFKAHIKNSITTPSQMFSPSFMSLAPERSDVGDGKGQMKPEVRSPDLLKRKWSSTEEKGGQEGREDHKRAKSEPAEVKNLPVTTSCGHTFCLRCLERCMDHNPKCPLCKEELSEFLVQGQYCKTVLIEKLILRYFPSELKERQKIHQDEMAELSNLNKNVPIFVCTMAFPTVPCPLHIFEPCYRLMIRRCIETGTNCFGMCMGNDLKGFADYGCLLEIRDVQFFSDGRSVVDTIGMRRFKVIQHRERDGYNTADIEYLEDVKVEGLAERELQSLHDSVYDQALVWVNSLKKEQRERIEGHFGPMPQKDSKLQPQRPLWCWWLLAVLPLEGRAQLPFLALTSLKDRLSGIRKVLLFMAHSRVR